MHPRRREGGALGCKTQTQEASATPAAWEPQGRRPRLVLKAPHPCSFPRNGLGPVKEGEAQYAVVHCTGYIKAWPPAGKPCGPS